MQIKKINSWGNFSNNFSLEYKFKNLFELKKHLKKKKKYTVSGNYRSYGDSCLNKNILNTRNFSKIIFFDKKKGILRAQSGVTLKKILELIVPHGWFLMVTPGTKYVTLGGAISSDIHGKNHHRIGCFSECVINFKLMKPNGKTIDCSKKNNKDYFRAVCGGMGLIGVVTEASIKLLKIKSTKIEQDVYIAENLEKTFEYFEKYKKYNYSSAWVDTIKRNNSFGRSVFLAGNFSRKYNISRPNFKEKKIPFFFKFNVINNFTINLFNLFYYFKSKILKKNFLSGFDQFFFPLDTFVNWNLLYGKKGFLQYQFIIPKKKSYVAMLEILKEIEKNKIYSSLGVLKLYGKKNLNYLSFPIKGYSLAIDFPNTGKVLDLLEKLDLIVNRYNGRIYLAKDNRIRKKNFFKNYDNFNQFLKFRKKVGAINKFNSNQSKRIGI